MQPPLFRAVERCVLWGLAVLVGLLAWTQYVRASEPDYRAEIERIYREDWKR